MVEKIRLFVGSTELNYNSAILEKSNDHIVDGGNVQIEAESSIVSGSLIDYRKADGVTTIFSAKVLEKKKEILWNLKLLTNGYELYGFKIQNVYENLSPEAIVQEIIDDRTANLTFASTDVSGITITKYIADAYAIDIIRDLMDLLQWQIKIDQNNNFFFQPRGTTDNGKTFIYGGTGANFEITEHSEDETELFNRVKVIGGFQNFNTTEVSTTAGVTAFPLEHKPFGNMIVSIGTTTVVAQDNYNVDADNKQVIFTAITSNPTFQYSFNRPVIVDNQNEGAITKTGYEIQKDVEAPFLDNFTDARQYSQNLLDSFSTPIEKVKGFESELNFDTEPGDQVTVIDNARGTTQVLVISKITLDAAKNQTKYELGSKRPFIFMDWQREVQERIKKIERRSVNEDEIIFSRLFKHNLRTKLTVKIKNKFKQLCNSFSLGHETLGRLRSGFDFEADCSDSNNHGTWTGTGVTTGDQFNACCGLKLGDSTFNGTDRKITVTDDASLQLTKYFSLALGVKVTALPGTAKPLIDKVDTTDGYEVNINASNEVELKYKNGGSIETFSTGVTLPINNYQYVIFTQDPALLSAYVNGTLTKTAIPSVVQAGVNTENFIVGSDGTKWYAGNLDELRVYTTAIPTASVNDLNNKISVTDNQALYLSMDNPVLGDQSLPLILFTSNNSIGFNFADNEAKDSSTTSDWNNTLDRLAMNTSSDHLRAYNTMTLTKKVYCGGLNFTALRITADETKFGNDKILYFISADGGSNWQEYNQGTTAVPSNSGTDPRVRVVFIGSGGQDTFIKNLILHFEK